MPSRKRASSPFKRRQDDDAPVSTEEGSAGQDGVTGETAAGLDADSLALADEAEAEAAEAEAIAAAARARARALRLRREAEEARALRTEEASTQPSSDESVSEPAPADVPVADQAPGRRALRIPLPTWRGVALSAAVVVIAALLAASGYMIWSHREVNRLAQLNGEYTAASRQAVVTLMSLDFNNAKEDVQRIIDNSTGKFKEDFQAQAETFAQVAQESKVVTEVTVNATAVNRMDDTTANVLVSATSRVTNTSGANQDPRAWRLSVDLQRDGDQIKMSRVEFVP